MAAMETKSKGIWKGLLAGGLIGAATGLLFAPRLGKDTRLKLNEDASKNKGRIGEWMNLAQEQGSLPAETKEKLAVSDNSSLAQNEAEMKRLGKEMDAMKTNSELSRDGFVPDPVQS